MSKEARGKVKNMSDADSSAMVAEETPKKPGGGGGDYGSAPRPGAHPPGGGLFAQYKAEQGRATRTGSFLGAGAIVAWGAWFLYQQLQVFEGDEGWRLLITTGIPIAFAALAAGVTWWFLYVHRPTSDFMIATEGEMKKVSWSTRSEVIGSTKVVIMFTILLAVLLFVVDLFFQFVFSGIGVLKTT